MKMTTGKSQMVSAGSSFLTTLLLLPLLVIMASIAAAAAKDRNLVFDPCTDTKVQKWDGFSFGLAFASKDQFFFNQTQLSPCDSRLKLSSEKAELAVFRPKVDEISLLTLDASFNPSSAGGYMVAFAGRKYAARSTPVFVADNKNTITSFTLVLDFEKGTLQNLYWKKFGCGDCKGKNSVCVDSQDCGVQTSQCKGGSGGGSAGSVDCNIRVQVTFSGTDKNEEVLNSWYEVKNLRENSLYTLFANLRDSITDSLL